MTHLARPRPIAQALRFAAIAWLACGLVQTAIGMAFERAMARFSADTTSSATEDLGVLGTLATLNAVIGLLVIVIAAQRWAQAPGRAAVLVRAGQLGLAAAIVFDLAWPVLTLAQTSVAGLEQLQAIGVLKIIVVQVALAAVLVGTRAPKWIRVAYVAGAIAGHLGMPAIRAQLGTSMPWLPTVVAAIMLALYCGGLWRAAPAYADVEPEAPPDVDDPVRVAAAAGLTSLRTALIGRLALAILGALMLVGMRDAPGTAALVVWLLALAQCGLAVLLAAELLRYAALPEAAVERGYVHLVLAALVVGALIELVAAADNAEVFAYLGRVRGASSALDMPPTSELAAIQSRLRWFGRGAAFIGVVSAVSLAMTLRKTALWLDDAANVSRASSLAVATILGAGGAMGLLAVAQAGAVREVLVLFAIGGTALGYAVAVLVGWLRLLSGVAYRLRHGAPVGDADRSANGLSAR